MKIIIAMDSFKNTISSLEAGNIVKEAFKESFKESDIKVLPVADGGEGTLDALIYATGGKKISCRASDPFGNEIDAFYGVYEDTAIIETAVASGYKWIEGRGKNPLKATSFGTGEIIRHSLDAGYRKLIIGIGGSATNDGGMGLAQALGFSFTNQSGIEAGRGAQDLGAVKQVSGREAHPGLQSSEIIVLSDVQNPLLGENGATHVYGLQKGVTQDLYKTIEAGMENFADSVECFSGIQYRKHAGAGAAGGIGFILMALMKAQIKPGIETMLDIVKFNDHIKNSNLVITGEGKTDYQSAFGKAPAGIAKRAREANAKVIVISGSLGDGYEALYDIGVSAIVPCVDRLCDFAYIKKNAKDQLRRAALMTGRLLSCDF